MKYNFLTLTSEILSHRVIVRMLYISLFVPHFVCISDVDQLVGWQVWLLSRDLTVLPFTLLTSSSLDEARGCPCHQQPPLNNSLTSSVIFLSLSVVFVNFWSDLVINMRWWVWSFLSALPPSWYSSRISLVKSSYYSRLITFTKFKFQSWNFQYLTLEKIQSEYFPIFYKMLNVFEIKKFLVTLPLQM